MYPNYGMWPPMWPPQQQNLDDTLRALHKMRKLEKKRQREEAEEGKKKEPPKRKSYTLLDVFLILFSCSWFVGPITAMAMIKVTQNFLLTMQPLIK